MGEQPDYNRPLRSTILICSIRTEEAASDVIRNMLRVIKGDTKTLGNKSSSLSFKNKIDLLYDIDDLNKDQYTQCLKFMELRNQFMHNPKCNCFRDLESEAPDVANFLKTKLPNEQTEPELNYSESFRQLWIHVLAKLLMLKMEYRKGIYDELMKFVKARTVDNFDNIFRTAYTKWNETQQPRPKLNPILSIGYDNSEHEISNFEYHLKMSIFDEQIRILDLVEQKQFTEKDIYRRRSDLDAEIRWEMEEERRNKRLDDEQRQSEE